MRTVSPEPVAWPPRVWRWLLLAALLPLSAQLLALHNPDMVTIDCEERYNAAHAWLWTSHPLETLRLQYRVFCGGCTLVSVLGAVPLRVLGASFGAWKLVALGFTGLAGAAGCGLLYRRIGGFAASAFTLLLLFAPLAYIRMSLLSWGNHVEVGVLALCALGLVHADRPGLCRLGGAVAGVALWTGFSAVPLLMGWVIVLALRRDRPGLGALAAGGLVAAALWGLQWATTGTTPFGAIYGEGELVPSLLGVPAKLAMLFGPRPIAGLLGLPRVSLGVPLGYAALASLGVATVVSLRRGGVLQLAAAMLMAWVAAFLLVGFGFSASGPDAVPTPTGLRYAGAVFPLGMLVVAGVAGVWWGRGRRVWAALLLCGPLATGVAARAATLTAPFPDAFVWTLRAVDWPKARWTASFLLPPEAHAQCDVTEADEAAVHAYARGRRQAWEAFSETRAPSPPDGPALVAAGVGAETIDRYDPELSGSIGLQASALRVVADWPKERRETAMEEILEERVWARGDRGFGVVPEPAVLLASEQRRVQALPPTAHDVAWRVAGRRWARQRARTALPVEVVLPDGAPLPFVEGVGAGLGEEWGPRVGIPRPAGLPDGGEASLLQGYGRGLHAAWRGGGVPVLEEASGADLEADRWWGPVPPQLCRCRVACE